jgi:hypothetical protein
LAVSTCITFFIISVSICRRRSCRVNNVQGIIIVGFSIDGLIVEVIVVEEKARMNLVSSVLSDRERHANAEPSLVHEAPR